MAASPVSFTRQSLSHAAAARMVAAAHAHVTDFTLLGGGVPIQVEGQTVGAIGVSGGHYTQDEACALAAVAALTAREDDRDHGRH